MAPPLVIDPPCVIEKLKSSSFFFDLQIGLAFVWQVTTAIINARMTCVYVLLCNNFTTGNQLYLNWLLTPMCH